MKRRYPAKLFYWGILTNFLFHFIWLSVPGLILCLIGIWSRFCLRLGLGILVLDLILSIVEQLRIRKAALTPSNNPEFNQLMEALTGPGGLEAFGKVIDEKIKNTPPVELTEEET
jgi:hypothetical protein